MQIFNQVMWAVAIVAGFYSIPYLIRKGWGDAENNTRKVCDTCFRDIKRVNDIVNKLHEEAMLTQGDVGREVKPQPQVESDKQDEN